MLRDAATVVVLREADPFEVLLLRRHHRSGFAARAWVFPGGVVDDADRSLDPALWRGIDPIALAPRFQEPPEVVLGLHVAAVRETFEEAGLLLGVGGAGAGADLADPGTRRVRAALAAGNADGGFVAWLRQKRLVLDLAALTYFARWVTPAQEPKRYDTAFFLTRLPPGQAPDHDATEVTAQRWIAPAAALEHHRRGGLAMLYPTVKTLEALAVHDSIDALVAAAGAQEHVRSIQPHLELGEDGRVVRLLHPDDPDYPRETYREAGGR